MKSAPIPDDEDERLSELKSYHILDTLPEQEFDDLTLLASHICDTPLALISLVDDHRQWFKSRVGLDASETPKDLAFCAHAILGDELFLIKDSLKDERFHDNPLVTGDPHVRFYAGAPLITPSGHKLGTICVIDDHPRDMTSTQKEALMALSRQVITQLELREAKAKADESTRTKSLFLANMSHEIRTPMNAVISCTHLLKDELNDKRSLNLLSMIEEAGDTLLTLINDILDFSKLESGQLVLENKAFDLHDSLTNMCNLISKRADESNITLTVDISSDTPQWVSGDITRFRQIVLNLVGNAIKFSKSMVRVSLSRIDTNDQSLILLSVEDDGIGISEKDQPNIFKEFSQADASTTRKHGGTGLGLAICRSLTTAMHGQLWFDSQVDIGSKFYASMLLNEAAPVLKESKKNLSEIQPDMGEQLPLNILLAEDDPVNQIITEQLFEKIGYFPDIVSDGQQAYTACVNKDYDVVFMDMQMPKMDGITATIKTRQADIKQPYIIALTANAFPEDKAACLNAGMNGFLTKPIDLASIVAELHKAIDTQPVNS